VIKSKPQFAGLVETDATQLLDASAPGCFAINPLKDPRWERFLAGHPRSSVYHTVPWLRALQQAYGYEPIAFTTSSEGEALRNAIVFCDVKSWLTGRRLVSLPFSDDCAVLFDDPAELGFILSELNSRLYQDRFDYIELRPTDGLDPALIGPHRVQRYYRHQLDLTPGLSDLFANFHENSTQRKIRRSQREGLKCQTGRSPRLLNYFYELLVRTRRRHGVPPQPKKWFEALIDSFQDGLEIRVAFKDNLPIAAMLTLCNKDTLLYKYGASDERFHNLGGVHSVFWTAIVEAKQAGLKTFDLGRSARRNAGLITFKNRWGATCTSLSYLRSPPSTKAGDSFLSLNPVWTERAMKMVFSNLPGVILRIAGGIIYPHIG